MDKYKIYLELIGGKKNNSLISEEKVLKYFIAIYLAFIEKVFQHE